MTWYYKNPLSNKTRRRNYNKLRGLGFDYKVACKVRQWRKNNIKKFVETFRNKAF